MELLQVWTIYDHPLDFPGCFVVRRSTIVPPTQPGQHSQIVNDTECQVAPTLEAARAIVPEGLHCMPGDEDDDPAIVEVWL